MGNENETKKKRIDGEWSQLRASRDYIDGNETWMGTTRLDISYQEEDLEKKWERKARKHRAGKESDKMQTEEIRKIGNEMQKDPASNEEYSKREGKYKRAGRGTDKEEEEQPQFGIF